MQTQKLSHIVAERLREQIAAGELVAGDSLPSEAELLAQLGISRPTLREALRVLEAENLIRLGRGARSGAIVLGVLEAENLIRLGRGARSGAIVLGPSVQAAARHSAMYLASHGTTLREIHQVRMLIEPSLASLLAQRTKREHIKALRQWVDAQQASLAAGDYASAIAGIMEFHSVMVRSAENRAFGLLAGILQEISLAVYPLLLTGSASERQTVRRRTEQSATAHRELLNLITQNKARDAENFWREYMQDTDAFLSRTGLGNLRVRLHKSD